MIDFKELATDGVSFEQLVRELLMRSNFEVHWTGVGPDGGRDLVITEEAFGQFAAFRRKWLVSCKHKAHSGKAVGLGDIVGLVDACAAIGAEGVLLACSTYPSASVVRRFKELEAEGKLLARIWDGIELEKRLTTAATFALVHLFFPESSKRYVWQVYNTNSPSLWAANYQEYFIYLSCRLTTSFPKLEHVEQVVKRLKSIPLPKGDTWRHHYLRPRAVYYDNKNAHYFVYADYLFPTGSLREVLDPEELNRYLHDGGGLYGDTGEYLTYWDIAYIDCDEMSDNFQLDHKKFYEPYIRNFHSGLLRDETIGDKLLVKNKLVWRGGKLQRL